MEFANKQIYVTGGRTGFLGANFTKALLEKGATVHTQSFRPEKQSHFTEDTLNLTQKIGPCHEIPKETDYVFHCAAHTSGAYEMVHDPAAQVNENAFMNSLLLDAAVKARVKKLVFISSSAIYPACNWPMPEEDGFRSDPPPSYFGPAWMKRYSEKLCEFYASISDMEVLVIRPSNVYGPYSGFDPTHSHVLPALIRKFVDGQSPLEVWGSGDVRRDFIYADDFVHGVFKAFDWFSKFDVFNIAVGDTVSIQEAVDIIAKLTNYKGEIVYNNSKPTTIHTRAISALKAQKAFGLDAPTSFEVGLHKTIDWYKNNVKH